MEIKLTILVKKADNKAFKGSDNNWYNLNDNVIPYLTKLNKGDEIIASYDKKGISRYVSKIIKATASASAPKEEPKPSTTGFACEVCGKELKDGKFKTCYMCNKKGATKGKTYTKTSYDSPEKQEKIMRGNALNAAAAVASSQQFADPDVAKQFTLLLAEDFLTWLRAE